MNSSSQDFCMPLSIPSYTDDNFDIDALSDQKHLVSVDLTNDTPQHSICQLLNIGLQGRAIVWNIIQSIGNHLCLALQNIIATLFEKLFDNIPRILVIELKNNNFAGVVIKKRVDFVIEVNCIYPKNTLSQNNKWIEEEVNSIQRVYRNIKIIYHPPYILSEGQKHLDQSTLVELLITNCLSSDANPHQDAKLLSPIPEVSLSVSNKKNMMDLIFTNAKVAVKRADIAVLSTLLGPNLFYLSQRYDEIYREIALQRIYKKHEIVLCEKLIELMEKKYNSYVAMQRSILLFQLPSDDMKLVPDEITSKFKNAILNAKEGRAIFENSKIAHSNAVKKERDEMGDYSDEMKDHLQELEATYERHKSTEKFYESKFPDFNSKELLISDKDQRDSIDKYITHHFTFKTIWLLKDNFCDALNKICDQLWREREVFLTRKQIDERYFNAHLERYKQFMTDCNNKLWGGDKTPNTPRATFNRDGNLRRLIKELKLKKTKLKNELAIIEEKLQKENKDYQEALAREVNAYSRLAESVIESKNTKHKISKTYASTMIALARYSIKPENRHLRKFCCFLFYGRYAHELLIRAISVYANNITSGKPDKILLDNQLRIIALLMQFSAGIYYDNKSMEYFNVKIKAIYDKYPKALLPNWPLLRISLETTFTHSQFSLQSRKHLIHCCKDIAAILDNPLKRLIYDEKVLSLSKIEAIKLSNQLKYVERELSECTLQDAITLIQRPHMLDDTVLKKIAKNDALLTTEEKQQVNLLQETQPQIDVVIDEPRLVQLLNRLGIYSVTYSSEQADAKLTNDEMQTHEVTLGIIDENESGDQNDLKQAQGKKNDEKLPPIVASVKIRDLMGNHEKFAEVDVTGDGSCLPYSVTFSYLLPVLHDEKQFNARCLNLFGKDKVTDPAIQDLSKFLKIYRGEKDFVTKDFAALEALIDINFRQNFIQYMREHRADYAGFFLKDDKGSDKDIFEAYLKKQVRPKEWCGEHEIRAISAMLQVRIEIYLLPSADGQFVKPRIHGELFVDTIRLVHADRGTHYHYLIPLKLLDQAVPASVNTSVLAAANILQYNPIFTNGAALAAADSSKNKNARVDAKTAKTQVESLSGPYVMIRKIASA